MLALPLSETREQVGGLETERALQIDNAGDRFSTLTGGYSISGATFPHRGPPPQADSQWVISCAFWREDRPALGAPPESEGASKTSFWKMEWGWGESAEIRRRHSASLGPRDVFGEREKRYTDRFSSSTSSVWRGRRLFSFTLQHRSACSVTGRYLSFIFPGCRCARVLAPV